MDIKLPMATLPQPDDTTCGPTCLHAVYNYYGDTMPLADVIADTQMLHAGGTLAVFLACSALRRGYQATIYTYNLQMFDPSWFSSPNINIAERLQRQTKVKQNKKLEHATQGYLEFLELGGKLRFTDLNTRLVRSIIRRRLPILTGLSSTYLYRTEREFGPDDEADDIQGLPAGHFVVLSGYHRSDRTVLIADPLSPTPTARTHVAP